MNPIICDGDLLEQNVEVIVNAWNQNFIPWWLLLPQGISGAIKKRGGSVPFQALSKKGILRLGEAVETTAGNLPFRAIIHVAGINVFWRSSERAIRACVQNAMNLAKAKNYRSIGFPVIGSGTGGIRPEDAIKFMREELAKISYDGDVRIVRYKRY